MVNFKEDEKLNILNHSCAHLMAQAIKHLYPNALFWVGPVIAEGFYYDVDLGDEVIHESDLERIEKEMKKLSKDGKRIYREEISKSDALERFKNDPYKIDLISRMDEENTIISCYTQGDFTDLCRGPHVESVKEIKHFKLIKHSGAYWKGNSENKMLQRIYGVCFYTEEELLQHLEILQEAKERDHRKLGKELNIFMTSDLIGKGLPIYLPNGYIIWEELEKYIKDNIYWGMTNSGYVFNGDFIQGLSVKEKQSITSEEVKKIRFEPVEQIENLITTCSKDVVIKYDGGNEAYYQSSTDSIHLPKKEKFIDKYSEYSTTLHEIAHSTGHNKRLDRNMPFTYLSTSYAKEELRAEIASMMLCMELGKNLGQPQFENHTAYLKSWIEVLNDDYTEFNRAVSDANKITEYVKSNYMNQQRQQVASPALQTMRDGANKVQKDMQRGQSSQKANLKQNGGNYMG